MSRRLPHESLPRTWTRRSVVEWLGKSTVVALSGKLLAACAVAEGEEAPLGACSEDDFLFVPGPEDFALYDTWFERTVDEQDVATLLAEWRLAIDGMVDLPSELTFGELLGLTRQQQVTDLHCVEGWSVYDIPWTGVHISTVLELVGVHASATHLTFTCQEGLYVESLPLAVALEPRTMLAYGVGCTTIPMAHGFPLRVVVPRKFGYKNAKFVRHIEVTDRPVQGYWVERGYTYEADVPQSRLLEHP